MNIPEEFQKCCANEDGQCLVFKRKVDLTCITDAGVELLRFLDSFGIPFTIAGSASLKLFTDAVWRFNDLDVWLGPIESFSKKQIVDLLTQLKELFGKDCSFCISKGLRCVTVHFDDEDVDMDLIFESAADKMHGFDLSICRVEMKIARGMDLNEEVWFHVHENPLRDIRRGIGEYDSAYDGSGVDTSGIFGAIGEKKYGRMLKFQGRKRKYENRGYTFVAVQHDTANMARDIEEIDAVYGEFPLLDSTYDLSCMINRLCHELEKAQDVNVHLKPAKIE